MLAPTKERIESALLAYIDPYFKKNLFEVRAVSDIQIQDNQVALSICLPYPAASYVDALSRELRAQIKTVTDWEVSIQIDWKIHAHAVQGDIPVVKGVKNIIAVASGKGGVGKSTTAVNLALALQAEGARVGLLDADIYGPSEPHMLGAATLRADSTDANTIEPILRYGLQTMSIGYLLPQEDTPLVWRGPMATGALMQLINQTQWDNLDYLIIDLPPGTGDIQLTLTQKIPLTGAIIVTTPQDLALIDVLKCMSMFQKVNVPLLGVVENMSLHVCTQCGFQEHIFGEGGAERIAEKYGIELLASVPLDKRIREAVDAGLPSVAADKDSAISLCYRDCALKMAALLANRPKNYQSKFPNIRIETDK